MTERLSAASSIHHRFRTAKCLRDPLGRAGRYSIDILGCRSTVAALQPVA